MQINEENYEDLLLSYLDGELREPELSAMKGFLREHPDRQKELEALRLTILPQEDVPFPKKESLYRKRKTRLVFLLPAAAAAVLILFLLLHRPPSPPKAAMETAIRSSIPVLPDTPAPHTAVAKPAAPGVHIAAVNGTQEDRRARARNLSSAVAAAPDRPLKQPQPKASTAEVGNEVSAQQLPPLKQSFSVHVPAPPLTPEVPVSLHKALSRDAPVKLSSPLPARGNVTFASIGEARQDMDHTITEKITEIQYEVSHPFNLLKGREIRIGNVSLAFSK